MATASAVHLSTEEFTRAFLPSSHPDDIPFQCTSSSNPFASLKTANKISKDQISELLVSAIGNDLAPNLTPSRYKPHTDAASNASARNGSTAIFRSACLPPDDQPHWTNVSVPIEVYRSTVDPFGIPGPREHESILQSRQKLFNRISTVAEVLFAAQQRIFLFMLLVIGRRFRFLRWDRSGVIVTPAIDYCENPDTLCDILWRISLCSDTQLGVDPTTTRLRPGNADYEKMSEAAKERADDVDEKERDLKPGELPEGDLVYKYVREMFSESVVSPWPRYRVEVPVGRDNNDDKDSKCDNDGNEDQDGKTTRQFLIAKPTFRTRSMSGRGTRGYVALDCETGKFVWLKDAWRAHYLLVDKEGDVLRRLNKAGVKFVPTLICHGDIGDQVTLTPDWWEAKNPRSDLQSSSPPGSCPSSPTAHLSTSSSSTSRKRKSDDESRSEDCSAGFSQFREDWPLRLHRHYRLVEKDVGMPLSNFTDGQQLASLVLDCIYAHYHAYTKPRNPVLHRDVSGGNILILPKVIKDESGAEIKWTGLLVDWEMSKPKGYQGLGRQPERTGTWQFLSVALLSGPKEVEVCDDELEAFFYVLLYYAIRYLHSNIDETAVGRLISSFFDTYSVKGNAYICGNEKLAAIKSGKLVVAASNTELVEFGSPLDHLLENFLNWFKGNHVVSKYEEQREKKNIPPPPQAALPLLSGEPGADRLRKRRRGDRFTEEEVGAKKVHVLAFGNAVAQPSDDDWAVHDQVRSHGPMMQLLADTIDASPSGCLPWKANDKVDGPAFAATMPLLTAQRPPKTPERKQPFVPPYITAYGKQKQH